MYMGKRKKLDLSLGSVYGDMLNGLRKELVAEGKIEPPKPKLPEHTCKIIEKSINKFMKKSVFDKLYESVMAGDEVDDLQELGIDDDSDGGDLGEDTGDSVTFTLDRATAQALCDVLTTALGDGSDTLEDADTSDEFGDDDFVGEDEGFLDEDEETLGSPVNSPKQPDMGKNNKVGNLKPTGRAASHAVTDKVGNDGDHGHAIHSGKKFNDGKSNKVGSLKPGQSAFA